MLSFTHHLAFECCVQAFVYFPCNSNSSNSNNNNRNRNRNRSNSNDNINNNNGCGIYGAGAYTGCVMNDWNLGAGEVFNLPQSTPPATYIPC